MAESTLTTKGTVRSADGTKLAYRAWPMRGAVALAVVHGLGDHAGRYDRLANGMANHSVGTYAIDLRGHGLSEGQRGHVDSWSQWTDDVSAFVKHLESITGAEVVPVGHSFGGAALLSTVLAGKLSNTKRFIVSSPALKLKMTVPGWKLGVARVGSKIAPRLAMASDIDPATVSRMPEVVEAYRTDPLVHRKVSSRMGIEFLTASADILAQADQIKIPFLVLAGTDDQLVDPAGSEQLHEKAPSMSELHLLQGRYHEPFNDLGSEEVFQLIAGWLNKK